MSPAARNAVFQLFGGLLGLAIALAAMFVATTLFGRLGVFALVWAVPVGVITGWASIKLLHFAHRILSDQE